MTEPRDIKDIEAANEPLSFDDREWAMAAVSRANRLQRLIELNAPDVIIQMEKELLVNATMAIAPTPDFKTRVDDLTQLSKQLREYALPEIPRGPADKKWVDLLKKADGLIGPSEAFDNVMSVLGDEDWPTNEPE